MKLERLRDYLSRADAPPWDAVERLAREVASLVPERIDRPPRALLVGGLVRDALLGRTTTDADVEVFGVPAGRLESLLESLFPERVNTVGRSFGIFKVHLVHGIDLDVALPRTESKVASGHRGFTVLGDPFLPFPEAARRRDFTINALAADPLTGEILDGHRGLDDLAERALRAVDRATFVEDPLRVWRAVQLAARLAFRVEPGTVALMRAMVARGDLAELSRERVTEELRKLLRDAESPSLGLLLARDLGAVASAFPEIEALADDAAGPRVASGGGRLDPHAHGRGRRGPRRPRRELDPRGGRARPRRPRRPPARSRKARDDRARDEGRPRAHRLPAPRGPRGGTRPRGARPSDVRRGRRARGTRRGPAPPGAGVAVLRARAGGARAATLTSTPSARC